MGCLYDRAWTGLVHALAVEAFYSGLMDKELQPVDLERLR